ICFFAALNRGGVEGEQRFKYGVVPGFIALRSYIYHDEATYPLRVAQRETHCYLAPHRMPHHNGTGNIMLLKKLIQVGGHSRIGMFIAVRRTAVVTQIDGINLIMLRQLSGRGLPVIEGTEQSVENDQCRPVFSKYFIIE